MISQKDQKYILKK